MTDTQETETPDPTSEPTPDPTATPYVMLTFRTTKVAAAAIDAAAAREGIKRSEFIRRAVGVRVFIDEFPEGETINHSEDEQ